MKVWIVGKYLDLPLAWEFIGVCDEEEKAVKACLQSKDFSYFVGPIALNKILPDDTVVWEGAYYPHVGKGV